MLAFTKASSREIGRFETRVARPRDNAMQYLFRQLLWPFARGTLWYASAL